MEVNKDDRRLEDLMGEINWNKDEGIKNLLKIGEINSLKKEDVTSDGDSGNYNDVGDRNVSIHDGDLKENKEETTEKFEDELDKNFKVFCFSLTSIESGHWSH